MGRLHIKASEDKEMKLLERMQIWDLKRDIKHHESKIRLIKMILKQLKGGKKNDM